MIKFFSKEVSSAGKTQVGAASSLSSKVKHLVGADNEKVGSMRNVWDILLKSPTDQLKYINLLYKVIYS